MKVIVIGNGKVGRSLVEQLNNEGHDIVVIDKNIQRLEALNNSTDVLCINGDGIDLDILLQADISNADLVISTTSSDELNIVSSMIAKNQGAKNVVARIRSKEYVDQTNFIKKNLDIDYAINPELQTAKEIANQFRFVGDFKVETFAKGLVEVLSFKLDENSAFNDKTLIDINNKYKLNFLVCGVQRQEDVYLPRGDFKLLKDDIIYLMASNKEIGKIINILGKKDKMPDSVFIIGAGKLTYYLSKELYKMNLNIKIIDSNHEVCELLSEQLPYATIICGDATNQNILEEEGAFNSSAFIALTGNDEINLILSIYAKTKKIQKVITKVNQEGYIELAKTLGINNIFAPREIITSKIISYFRSIEESSNGSANVVHRLVQNKIEAAEFTVKSGFKYTKKPLRYLNLDETVLVAGVVRNGDFIRANGDLTLEINDNVIVLAIDKKIISLEDIIK